MLMAEGANGGDGTGGGGLRTLARLRAENPGAYEAALDHLIAPSEAPPYWHLEEPEPAGAPQYHRSPLKWAELATREPPTREWAIKGWIGMGHVTLLVGPGGIGKSLLAQEIASCIALAHGFIDEIPRARRALMWACEDDHDEIWRRQIAISQWMRVPLPDYAPHLVIEPRHGRMNTMMQLDYGRPVITGVMDELAAQARDERAEVVIIDNAAQVFGAGENDRHAVTVFLNALCGKMPGAAILLLAHPSRSQGSEFSGSSAWENTARTRLYLGAKLPDQPQDEEADDDTRYLSRRKANYSDKDYRKLLYLNGVLRGDPSAGLEHLAGGGRGRDVIARALPRLQAMGVHVSDARGPNYLPLKITEMKLHEGLSKPQLKDAMVAMMLDGAIVKGQVGKYAKGGPRMGLVLADTKGK